MNNQQTVIISTAELEILLRKNLILATKEAEAFSTKLLSKRAAAKALEINRDTLARLIDAGKIQTTTDGRFIPQWSISEYLNLKKCQK